MSGNSLDQFGDGGVRLSDGTPVSLQVVQAVYREITGKTEKLAKEYQTSHQVTFADIENLYAKISQLTEQYAIQASSCAVTIFHIDDQREVFSSFERARIFEAGSLSPVENVQLEFRFLIKPPLVEKAAPCDIVVNVHSRIGLMEKAKTQNEIFEEMMYFVASRTGSVSIKYVDYAVARTVLRAIDEWFEGLPQAADLPFERQIRKLSNYGPVAFKYGTAALCGWWISRIFLDRSGVGIEEAVSFGVLAFTLIFVASGVGYQLGEILERSIARFRPLSFVKLNRGDEKLIQSFGKSHAWLVAKALASVLGICLLNIMSNWIGKILFGG